MGNIAASRPRSGKRRAKPSSKHCARAPCSKPSPNSSTPSLGVFWGRRSDRRDRYLALIPAKPCRLIGRKIASVRCGSGVIEKNIKVQINRRSKRQRRRWSGAGAQHLAATPLAAKQHPRFEPLLDQNRLNQNQDKPRLAFIPSTSQLTIDQLPQHHEGRDLACHRRCIPVGNGNYEQIEFFAGTFVGAARVVRHPQGSGLRQRQFQRMRRIGTLRVVLHLLT